MNKVALASPRLSSLIVLILMTAASVAFASGDSYSAVLTNAQEVPESSSPATATATVTFDEGFTQAEVDIVINDLIGNLVGAHFHCNRPGANGAVAFGLINPGQLVFDGKRIRGTLTNADFTGFDCASSFAGVPVNNIASLAFAMREGLIYLNLHTDAFPGGEIRGQMRK